MMQAQSVPTGILKPAGLGTAFNLERFAPSANLEAFVLRYWTVAWDVVEQLPYTQETLPYPCVNLVVGRGRSGIFGVNTRRFQIQLVGKGWVFGIKFRPGGSTPSTVHRSRRSPITPSAWRRSLARQARSMSEACWPAPASTR